MENWHSVIWKITEYWDLRLSSIWIFPSVWGSASCYFFLCSNSDFNFIFNKNCIYSSCTTWWFDIHSEMIIIVTLARYHFFVVMKVPKLHSVSKCPMFLIVLTMVMMMYIRSLNLFILLNCPFYHLANICSLSPTPHHW